MLDQTLLLPKSANQATNQVEQARARENGSIIVAAWGAQPAGKLGALWRDRVEALRAELGDVPLWCLGTCANGEPRHPLYLKGDAALVRWG